MRPIERLAYDLSQGARVAWFMGQYLATRRLSREANRGIAWPRNMPGRQAVLADMRSLFLRDRANVEAGIYRLPQDGVASPLAVLRKSRLFFRDLARVNERRMAGGHQEVEREGIGGAGLPRYYRQNFHYQTGGWLTEESARLYDYQVEVLFAGGANAMRRQALVPVHHFLKRRTAQGPVHLLDVACGTGTFLSFVRRNFPAVEVTGVDLSAAYLAVARRRLRRFGKAVFLEGAAEKLPFPDASFDLLTTVYLFHELPPAVRHRAVAEFARVLRPGGQVILVDTIQKGDHPPFDALLDAFPLTHHEPYYARYIGEDLDALFGQAGFVTVGHERAHLSKVSLFERPAQAGANGRPSDKPAAA
ncbi:class I SAM-dependent methyltransferase [Marinivivus vitaminiproducens]|uniref:class I SAM-dependent methyltransferase n=1 Tax=Marinivivus vitaminiproducens TaxID=3035935 RepID=UPI0027A950EC|nr:class I SAM-dependent methyltransferase [Geminicoccaceae bacterium SCSIO 64248]